MARPLVAVALETSTRRPSVALRAGDRSRTRALEGERPHASDLLPALQELMDELGVTPREIATVAVGTGPGSYTGLRVGIATALGLARGAGATTVGVPSVESLVWGAARAGEQATVLLDARAGELYLATYLREADGLRTRVEACVISVDEFGPRWTSFEGRESEVLFADAGAVRQIGLTAGAGVRLELDVAPSAESLLELALRRLEREGPQEPASLEPLYLRAFAVKARKR